MRGKEDCNEKFKSLTAYSFKVDEQFLDEQTKLKMELEEMNEKIKQKKHELEELQKCQREIEMKQRLEDEVTDTLKHEMNLLRDKNKNYENEIQNLKKKIEALKNYKPSQKDAALLELCRHKYHLYKSITGVRWDYKSNSIHGYIVNKKTYYTKPFSLESPSEDMLWEEIAKAISADWRDFSCE